MTWQRLRVFQKNSKVLYRSRTRLPCARFYPFEGKPRWVAFTSFCNLILLLEITGKPLWWLVLFLIPVINFITFLIVMLVFHITLAERLGSSGGTVMG